MSTETPDASETQPQATPEQKRAQFQEFMTKVMGDISRLRSQVEYSHRHNHAETVTILDRLDYQDRCIGVLFETLQIPLPMNTPRLVDAQTELVAADDLPEGEVCEMQAAYSSVKHPIFGNMQIIIGSGEEAQATNPTQMHPIILKRLNEAFEALRVAGTLADGQFYFVRLGLIHAQAINENSVPFTPTAEAANDDTAPAAMEISDVQPE